MSDILGYTQHFGEQSANYLQFRPDYPQALYTYLIQLVKERECAWDCGTGNGQAAVKLAEYFNTVIATDINQEQLNAAINKNNIHYLCCAAEKTDIASASVDLITVAQALHWFNLEKFYQEVRRVSKPQGMIAAWCYALGKLNHKMDALITTLYSDILNHYWPKERRYIDEEYQTLFFPFEKKATPQFHIEKAMDFNQLIGYLNTWSAVKEYQKINQANPIDIIYSDLQKTWGNATAQHTMHWPIYLLVGKVI